MRTCGLLVQMGAVLLALGGSRASAEGGTALAVPASTDQATAASDQPLLEDYDEPVIVFGRAVDLAGRDIEPTRKGAGIAAVAGSMPGGRPLAGGQFTSGFGMRFDPLLGTSRFHAGIDIAAAIGTPVTATGSGRVEIAGWSGNYGVLVEIDHGGSVETRYAHLSAIAVHPGDAVKRGQVIGYVGSTGRSTGPHLHYETRIGGRPANPLAGW